jgi:hypothetical protein
MLGDLIDIRTKTLAILSLSLHDWYKQKRVVRTPPHQMRLCPKGRMR